MYRTNIGDAMSSFIIGLLLATPTASAAAPPEPTPTVFVQTWVTLMDQDQSEVADPGGYGDPEDDPGFKLRRVRLGFEGDNDTMRYGFTVGVSAPYDVVSEAQGAGMEVGLVDSYGGYSPTKGLWIVGGRQKVPVSRESLMSSSQLGLSDRSVSTQWLTPDRDLGAVVDYRWKFLRARVGAFNGGGDLSGDNNDGKLISGRMEAKIGPGAVYRTYGEVKKLTIGMGVGGWTNDDTAVSTNGLGADVIVRLGGLAVMAEARVKNAEPKEELVEVPDVFSETTRQGVMAQVGYTVDQFEPIVRYSVFDDDTSTEDTGDVSEIVSGVTWHADGDGFRAGLAYAMRSEQGPMKVENDTVRVWLQFKL
jgi:hypothetical protein